MSLTLPIIARKPQPADALSSTNPKPTQPGKQPVSTRKEPLCLKGCFFRHTSLVDFKNFAYGCSNNYLLIGLSSYDTVDLA